MGDLYGITTCYQEEKIQQLLHDNEVKYLKITEHNSSTTFLYVGYGDLLRQIINLITIEYDNAMCDIVSPFKVLTKFQDFRSALCDKPSRKTFHFERWEYFESIKSKMGNQSSFDVSKTMDSIKKTIINSE